MSRAKITGRGRGRGTGRGRGRSQTTGLLRDTAEGPNLSDTLPPQPSSSLNVYPTMGGSNRTSPPVSRQDSSNSNNSRLAGAPPPPSSSMGFHDSQQQQQPPRRGRSRQDSDLSQETLVNDAPNFQSSFGAGPPHRAGTSPHPSVYSSLSHSKRSAPYATMNDSLLLAEPGPFDSVSQRGPPSEYGPGGRGLGRSQTYDETASIRGYVPSLPPDSSQTGFRGGPPNAEQLRHRLPSVMGSASDFLGRFDPNDRFTSSMSVVSTDREATSDAWVRRQCIKPGRAKTKKVKLTKGRFIAEYGKPNIVEIRLG